MSTAPSSLPSADERQNTFEQGVALALHLWPALTLAVQNSWGGPDSSDKRAWFAGAVAELFPAISDTDPRQNNPKSGAADGPDVEDVETVMLQVMVDEFEVNVDDDSGFEVAQQIMRLRTQCEKGQFDEVESLRTRWNTRKGVKVDGLFKKTEDADQDTDWESDESGEEEEEEGEDGDGDVDMDEAPALVPVARERPAPEVDEEGFTKVTKKRR